MSSTCVNRRTLGSSNGRGAQIAHPSSAQQIEVAAVAEGKATLPAATHAISQALAGPVAVDALPAVDHHGRFAQRKVGAETIESDQRIAEPLSLRGPGWRCAGKGARHDEQGIKIHKPLRDSADVAAAAQVHGKGRGSDDGILPSNGELQQRDP